MSPIKTDRRVASAELTKLRLPPHGNCRHLCRQPFRTSKRVRAHMIARASQHASGVGGSGRSFVAEAVAGALAASWRKRSRAALARGAVRDLGVLRHRAHAAGGRVTGTVLRVGGARLGPLVSMAEAAGSFCWVQVPRFAADGHV